MEEFLPLLFVFIVWGMISSGIRNARRNQKTGRPNPRQTHPASDGSKTDTVFPAPDREAGSEDRPAPSAARTEPLPSRGASQRRLRDSEYGSLSAGSMEGIDPCHDDPGAMVPGSLSFRSEEGHDPCHDGWIPAAPFGEADPPSDGEAPAGLNLSWTSSDIVRGFVCGEILKRKTG